MRFIASVEHPWLSALRALGHEALGLCVPEPVGIPVRADGEERRKWAGAVEHMITAAAQSAGGERTVLLDDADLTLASAIVERVAGAVSAPLHEASGLPLVAPLTAEWVERETLEDWSTAWSLLHSRTWIKIVEEEEFARELKAFGVPSVVHLLPSARAPGEGASAGPRQRARTQADSSPRCPQARRDVTRTSALFAAVLAEWVRADEPEVTFFDTVFHLYRMLDAPSPSDDLETAGLRARQYFELRRQARELAAPARRHRFLELLKRNCGERPFHAAPCIVHLPDVPAGGEIAETGWMHVGLPLEDSPVSAVSSLLESIAAGGFMLAHRSIGLGALLRAGDEFIEFRDERELPALISHYRTHPGQRRAIAECGRQRVQAEHMLIHRVARLVDFVQGSQVAPWPPIPAAPVRRAMTGTFKETRSLNDAPRALLPASRPERANVRTLMVLQNPGRVSRFYLEGAARGAVQLGLQVRVLELGQFWSHPAPAPDRVASEIAAIVRRERVDAVLGYTFNGVFDLPRVRGADGTEQTLFAALGLPHLMLWTDHPHWAHERAALQPAAQEVLRQWNHVHFLKSRSAADELSAMLKWTAVHGLAVGEDPRLVRPRRDVKAQFDAVLIVGSPPYVPPELAPFVDQSEPDESGVLDAIAGRTSILLDAVWERSAPPSLKPRLKALGRAWVDARRADPHIAAFRHFTRIAPEHEDARSWLHEHPLAYFDGLHAMWEFGRWQRTLIPLVLSRRFRVGVFGHDWSSVGIPGSAAWVDYEEQSGVYARGRVAININQCNDEEGVSHKAFQITASGVPCLHLARVGLDGLFDIGREIEAFSSIAEAAEKLANLLADPSRREALASAGLSRFRRDHTWSRRLEVMLKLAAESGVGQAQTPADDIEARAPRGDSAQAGAVAIAG